MGLQPGTVVMGQAGGTMMAPGIAQLTGDEQMLGYAHAGVTPVAYAYPPEGYSVRGGAQQEVMYGEAPGMMMAAPVGSGARMYGAAAAGPTAVPGGGARAAGWVPFGGEMGQMPSGSRGLVSKPPGVQLGGAPSSGAMAGGNLVQFMDPSGQVYYLSQGTS